MAARATFREFCGLAKTILKVGSYLLKVEAADQLAIAGYTLTVTALQPGDIFLEHAAEGLSAAIRLGESQGLGMSFENTYSHAALYLGSSEVAEMLATGHAVRPIAEHFAEADLVDIYRHNEIGKFGEAVANKTRSYANTPYAFSELAVLGLAAVNPNNPNRVKRSLVYQAYAHFDAGPKHMICSELVVRAYAAVNLSLAIDTKLWPTMAALGNSSVDFAMDFTTPTMLSLSSDLKRLNA